MADKKKPGVMLYFNPVKLSVESMSEHERSELFLAIMRYADPDDGREPDFAEDTLRQVWFYVKSLVDRDDDRYKRTSRGNQYSQFCRWYERKTGRPKGSGKEDVPRQLWEELGCPSYSQLEKMIIEYDRMHPGGDTNVYERMADDTNVYERIAAYLSVASVSDSDSDSDSDSFSSSASVSTSKDVSPRINPPGPPPPPPTIEEVQKFCWEENLVINPMKFYLHYESKGWTMKDWKATAKKWDYEDREKAAKAKGIATDAEIAKYVRELHRQRQSDEFRQMVRDFNSARGDGDGHAQD